MTNDARNVIFLSFGLNDVAEVGGIARMPRHRTLQNIEEILMKRFDDPLELERTIDDLHDPNEDQKNDNRPINSSFAQDFSHWH